MKGVCELRGRRSATWAGRRESVRKTKQEGKTLKSRATGAGVETDTRLAARLAARRRAIPTTRAICDASTVRRRRRYGHAAAVSGRSIQTAFLKTPRSCASEARVRASDDAPQRDHSVEDCARHARHRYRAHAAHSTTRAPASVSPPPSPARARARARTHRSHDALLRRRNRASRALATCEVTPGIARAVGTCAYLSWTWCLLCCLDSALLCAVEKGCRCAGASVKKSISRKRHSFFVSRVRGSPRIQELLDHRLLGPIFAYG